MGLTSAEAIRKKTINNPDIRAHVDETIDTIDSKINEMCITTNKIDHEMPKDIFIPGLDRKNAQRIVYYQVAKQIIKAGYTLQITFRPKVIFHISWITDMDDEDAHKLDQFLVSLMRKSDEKQPNPQRPDKATQYGKTRKNGKYGNVGKYGKDGGKNEKDGKNGKGEKNKRNGGIDDSLSLEDIVGF